VARKQVSLMEGLLSYRLLADAVLLLHFAVVVFVVGGLVVVVVGNLGAGSTTCGSALRTSQRSAS